MWLVRGLIVALALVAGSHAWADCLPNACQYGSGCYSENAILCQDGQRMQCKGASWTAAASGPEGACSGALKLITIIEATIAWDTPPVPAREGSAEVPARHFEDTMLKEVAALCNYRENCSFVPRDLRTMGNVKFSVLKIRYACRDRATGETSVHEPKLPNDGDGSAVYTLDCFGKGMRTSDSSTN